MISKMTKYSFILLSTVKDSFLEDLQALGVVDITRSAKPVDEHSASLLSEIEGMRSEIKILQKGEDSVLAGMLSERKLLEKELEELLPWGEFDIDALKSIPGVEFKFYCTDAKRFNPEWEQQWALEKIHEDSKKVWFVIAGDSDSFPVNPVATPGRTAEDVRKAIAELDARIQDYRQTLLQRKDEIPSLEEQCALKEAQFELYLAGQTAQDAAESMISVMVGFAPAEEDQRLCQAFDSMDVLYFKEEACTEDKPPIKLKNNRFVSMFEVLTDMYGRPAYNGFDPTPFISVFFMLFFAMCMGDAGYGAVLLVLGFLLKKVKSFASLAPLVSVLGAATIVVGFFFHTAFSVDFLDAMPAAVQKIMVPVSIAGYDGTMVLALIVGIIHLSLAMIVKTYQATKTQGFLNALATWGWTLFLVGTVIVATVALAGVIDSKTATTVIIVLGIISAIGIFPLNNIHRNPLVNVGSGLWDTYNMATGVLGDVLSYLRLYALGLAGAKLGFAFNTLALQALGDGGFGWVPFILIALIGHVLNVAMAALGAFVHPLRLNFLEFFKNSGYEAEGVKYNPLKK